MQIAGIRQADQVMVRGYPKANVVGYLKEFSCYSDASPRACAVAVWGPSKARLLLAADHGRPGKFPSNLVAPDSRPMNPLDIETGLILPLQEPCDFLPGNTGGLGLGWSKRDFLDAWPDNPPICPRWKGPTGRPSYPGPGLGFRLPGQRGEMGP